MEDGNVSIMMLLKESESMRTTLTLDDDVAALVQEEARRSGASLRH
jgi:Arc/MetJ family transcription regulator